MTDYGSPSRMREAAARCICRALQRVRIEIHQKGTACLALRRLDKAEATEQEAMYCGIARLGQIMATRLRLRDLATAHLAAERVRTNNKKLKNPQWQRSEFAREVVLFLGRGDVPLQGEALQQLLTTYATGVESFPKFCGFMNERGAAKKWVAGTCNNSFTCFNFLLRKLVVVAPQYAGPGGYRKSGFFKALVHHGSFLSAAEGAPRALLRRLARRRLVHAVRVVKRGFGRRHGLRRAEGFRDRGASVIAEALFERRLRRVARERARLQRRHGGFDRLILRLDHLHGTIASFLQIHLGLLALPRAGPKRS